MVLAAGQTANEGYTFKDMLKQDDYVNCMKVIDKEISSREKMKYWEVVSRSYVPIDITIIQAIWGFKWERFPCSLLNKHKARVSSWLNAAVRCQLLGDVCSHSDLD